MSDLVRVYAPATVANVCCAFDILGFALDHPGDEVEIRRCAEKGVRIAHIEGDGGKLPRDPGLNTASVAVRALLSALGSDVGMEITLRKKMPLGSGLGSSAASAAAAVVAANCLLGSPMSRIQLVPFALEGERAACGAAHADNAAPSILGGFVLIRSYHPLDVIELSAPADLCAAVVHPNFEVRTADARKVLRQQIQLKDAVTQWANIAGLMVALQRADLALLERSLRDVIVEPQRSLLIPGFEAARTAALAEGAIGFSLSGSGPSVFSFARSLQHATCIGNAVLRAFQSIGISGEVFVSRINRQGAQIL